MEEYNGDINIEQQIGLLRHLTLTTGALHSWQVKQLKYYMAFVFDNNFNKISIDYIRKEDTIFFEVSLSRGQKLPDEKTFNQRLEAVDQWVKHLLWDTMCITIKRGKKIIFCSKKDQN